MTCTRSGDARDAVAPGTEAGLWHPVAATADLGADPLAVRLLGRDLVLWRDDQGRARAFDDRCPHRGAALSLGRVVDGTLQCPYHGWRFEGAGACTLIPATPGFRPPATHAVPTHALREAHGLLWLRLSPPGADADTATAGDAADAGLPDWRPDAGLRHLLVGPYEVATSAPRLVENFLDVAHFGFVHDGWLGDDAHAGVAPVTVTPTAAGFAVTGVRAWQPQATLAARGGSWVDYRYELLGPYAAALRKLPEVQAGAQDSIALFACPVDDESTRVWFAMAVSDHAAPEDALRAFQHTIFTQDQPVLESQRPRRLPVSEDAPREVHGAADRVSSAYRRWLRERGVRTGTC
jgi:phenylpropionate dioxygenase-like ring-hydroxylating dioxygenase large terminal subunit